MKPYDLPDSRGHFGPYGGIFVAETLMHALDELRSAYLKYQHDPEFVAEFQRELKHFVGRPSPIYHARRWSELLGGAQIYLKREDSESHRRAQDQQHRRAGAARETHGQAARDRGNRRRAARRGNRDGRGALRDGMRGLHGRGRHGAAGGQCLSHEAAGRDGSAGQQRQPHAERCAE